MKLMNSVLLVSSVLVMIACGNKYKSAEPVAASPATTTTSTSENHTVVAFRYYKGGFYAAPGQPNWTNDMTIKFSKSGFRVTGKHPDSLCSRGDAFSEAQTKELFDLVYAMTVTTKQPGGPTTADAGVEYIEISMESGELYRYHLMTTEAPVGEMLVANPEPLRNYLQTLEAGLPTACQ